MPYSQPLGLMAGFHAEQPDPAVPELVHAGEQWVPRTFPIADHAHAVWEFYLQVAGETQWAGPERVYTVAPMDFFAVPPLVHHHLCTPAAGRHHFFYCALDLEILLKRLPEPAAAWREKRIVHVPQAHALLAPFRQLTREMALDQPHRATGLRLAVDTLVLEATRLRESPQAAAPLIPGHPAVLRARVLLDEEPWRPWRLASLAGQVGLSANHLAECFTRDVGMPPLRYLREARIERAKEALTYSDRAIGDLALDLGFSSSQHFAAVFKQHTGLTAREWQARSGAEGTVKTPHAATDTGVGRGRPSGATGRHPQTE